MKAFDFLVGIQKVEQMAFNVRCIVLMSPTVCGPTSKQPSYNLIASPQAYEFLFIITEQLKMSTLP